MGLLGRIREGLTRTTQQFVDRFEDIVRRADAPERRSRAVDCETLEATGERLTSADVGENTSVVSTNVFVKRASGWRLLVHHGSPGLGRPSHD